MPAPEADVVTAIVLEPNLITSFIIAIVISGLVGVGEILSAVRERPRSGWAWLSAVFLLDALISALAFMALVLLIKPDFPGQPYLMAVMAVLWGPLLFRMAIRFIGPDGFDSTHDLIGRLPVLRRFMYRRFCEETANWRATWIQVSVLPHIQTEERLKTLASMAETYVNSLHTTVESQGDLLEQIKRTVGDKGATLEDRAEGIVQLLVKSGAGKIVESFVKAQPKVQTTTT